MAVDRITKLREQYRRWKRSLLLTHDWVPIPLAFRTEHLRTVSSNALKVYLYLCLHANPDTGESRHSVKTIANYFGNTERAVIAWLKELQQRGLIARLQMVANTEAHTFVLPAGPVPETTEPLYGFVSESAAPYMGIAQQSTDESQVIKPVRLAQFRREQGLSLSQLSQRTGLAKGFLSDLERGKKRNPSLTHIQRLADGLGVSKTYLLGLLQEQG